MFFKNRIVFEWIRFYRVLLGYREFDWTFFFHWVSIDLGRNEEKLGKTR